MGFDEGRAETIRYHEELYSAPEAHDPDAWLNQPAPIVMGALQHLDRTRPVRVYDLGAGSGRHTIPLARTLPSGSRVVAVDLLDTAVQSLKERAARESVADVVIPVVADQEGYRFDRGPADLVLGVSTLEHVSSVEAFRDLLARMRDATAPGGVVVLVIATDRHEVADGETRPAQAELALTTEEAVRIVDEVYADWTEHRRDESPFGVTEERDGRSYELRSVNVRRVLQRPHE
ncbi:class I SAM-dependent methyltransferase [Arsenicicoccus sp. oral taxon 190]|uniref:class I SAM-dependent methyltransferase n=1 Tax=Arsenicicoccus sp. oral taxon 190 TaxID=1658671 RepID=UPI00067E50AE|nr:class I SAM-dependent methyltransferase [Arsenicicoccus sp. oral taxon 190]